MLLIAYAVNLVDPFSCFLAHMLDLTLNISVKSVCEGCVMLEGFWSHRVK